MPDGTLRPGSNAKSMEEESVVTRACAPDVADRKTADELLHHVIS